MDLDLWDCFGRKKTPSYNQRNTVWAPKQQNQQNDSHSWKNQISQGVHQVWSKSLLSTRTWTLRTLATPSEHSKVSDQTMGLHLAHVLLCWFCRVAAHKIKLKETICLYEAIRQNFPLSRMTTNNRISLMKFCYNTNFTLPKLSQRSRTI